MEIFPLVSAAGTEVTNNGTLDSILNVLIPLAIFVMFGFMIYKNFTTEIDTLIRWIRKQFEKKPDQQQVPINNPYMYQNRLFES